MSIVNTGLLISTVLALCLIGAGCRQQASPDVSARIISSVETLLSDYQTYVNSGKTDSMMMLYSDSPDFHWVEDGKIAYRSAEEIKKAVHGLREAFPLSTLELSNTTITPLPPDYAVVTALFSQSLTDSSGNGFSFSGALTMTVVKEQRGWKFLTGHTSSHMSR